MTAPLDSPPSAYSPPKVARLIYKTQGWKGFYGGFAPCLLRAFPVNASALFVYEGLMRVMGAEKVVMQLWLLRVLLTLLVNRLGFRRRLCLPIRVCHVDFMYHHILQPYAGVIIDNGAKLQSRERTSATINDSLMEQSWFGWLPRSIRSGSQSGIISGMDVVDDTISYHICTPRLIHGLST
jgi:hypothetical protein